MSARMTGTTPTLNSRRKPGTESHRRPGPAARRRSQQRQPARSAARQGHHEPDDERRRVTGVADVEQAQASAKRGTGAPQRPAAPPTRLGAKLHAQQSGEASITITSIPQKPSQCTSWRPRAHDERHHHAVEGAQVQVQGLHVMQLLLVRASLTSTRTGQAVGPAPLHTSERSVSRRP